MNIGLAREHLRREQVRLLGSVRPSKKEKNRREPSRGLGRLAAVVVVDRAQWQRFQPPRL